MRRAQRRRRSRGQAVIEMAMMIPLMFALIVNFIAVMVQVQVKAQLTAAISLAAESSITVPVKDAPASCTNAVRSFAFTAMSSTSSSVDPSSTWCAGVGTGTPEFKFGSPTGTACLVAPAPGHPTDAALCITYFDCKGGSAANYFDGSGYPPTTGNAGPPVTCEVMAHYDFQKTPLAFGILWKPTFDIQAQATPTLVRQCLTATC